METLLRNVASVVVVLATSAFAAAAPEGVGDDLGLAVLKPALPMGSVSAFWNVDRQYRDAPTLTPHSAVTVADLKGPAAITLLRVAQVPQVAKANLLRGIVLEIRFDDCPTPAVMCPLPDFFGDGCNGKAEPFASRYVEKVPVAYNAYFPMPFAKSAKVIFRNDTDINATSYAYLEWQALPAWREDLGYFHATYRRKAFLLTNDTREEFIRLGGRGHLVGRQFSIASDEPRFGGFGFVMEGNNEVDLDGRKRVFDYLGSEDSFTFSWGFNRIFAAPHAGMTHLVMSGATSRLSIYRFHDHMPIRWDREMAWTIDWRSEDVGFGTQSGWVDYATVFYWYQETPGGYEHAPLPPVAERCLDILPAPEKTPDLGAALEKVPLDADLANDFSAATDLERVVVLQPFPKTHPFWIDEPGPAGGHPGQPNPGRRGILAVHPEENHVPAFVIRKMRLPAGGAASVRVVVSGDPYEAPGRSDFVLRLGTIAGGAVTWLGQDEVIDAGDAPGANNWRTIERALPNDLAGKVVGVVVKIAYGGPKGICNEEAFFDEIAVVGSGR